EAVAAADLGDEGELLGEVQYALGGAVVVGVAVLHEAVEEVPVAAAGAGEDAAAGDEGLVEDHARVGFGVLGGLGYAVPDSFCALGERLPLGLSVLAAPDALLELRFWLACLGWGGHGIGLRVTSAGFSV